MLLTFINLLPFVTKIFVLSIFEWPFYTGFTIVGKICLDFGEVIRLVGSLEIPVLLFAL